MTQKMINMKKNHILLLVLSGFFLINTIVAEFIGIKIFSLEKTLGIQPFSIHLLGSRDLGFNLTAGVVLWPFVFVLTDVINEYFGIKWVKKISLATIALVFYAFLMVYISTKLTPNEWWDRESGLSTLPGESISSMDTAFVKIMGQSMNIIFASMVAFALGQLLDAYIFKRIKSFTGEKKVWLRATGSTLFSQLIDSYVVLIVAFYFLSNWDFQRVLAIGTINYIYKFIVAIAMTPIIYLAHYLIDKWLGKSLSSRLKKEALQKDNL